MSDKRLAGKVALVTGGSRGIGAAIALRFAADGAKVAVNYSSSEGEANKVVAAITGAGGEAFAVKANMGDPKQIADLFAAVKAKYGRLDILVNNAAEQHVVEEPLEISAEQLERTFRTNVFGYFFMTKAALRHMESGASIVNTTSVTAYQGNDALIDYAATRGAIVALTRSLAKALIDKGIRVNAVAPGPIWTPLIPASFDAEKTARHGSQAPMGRAGHPNEVASCHVFLASEEASYMSGQVLHPNGGTVVGS